MKLAAALMALLLVGVYSYGIVSLNERSALRFLDELESLSLQQKNDEYCARMHADLAVSIRDRSAEPPAEFDGNRADFCGYVSYAARSVPILGLTTRATRSDVTLTRDWLHPWTVRIGYREDRLTTLARQNTTVHTGGEDHLVLVQTLDGLKLRQLDSRSWAAE